MTGELGAGAAAAERCAIAFQSSAAGVDGRVFAAGGDSRWDGALNAVLDSLDNRLSDAAAADRMKRGRAGSGSGEAVERIALSAREIDAIAQIEKTESGRQLVAAAFTDGVSTVRIAMVAGVERVRVELDVLLELMARAAFGEIALAGARASLEFWRAHGAASGREAVGAKRELVRERAASHGLDEAVAAARRAPPKTRFGRFGELVAGGAGFDQWMVAVADGGALTITASSLAEVEQIELGETGSAMAESFRRRIVIARWRDRAGGGLDRVKQYYEDKVFAGSYVCIPFEAGAIALASSDGHASAERAEEIVGRLAPIAMSWVMERAAKRRAGLVRQLALRMFAAIDEERARIARDLHDDQAQLMAAVKIALQGPPEAARSIFKQVEEELRRKTRELRPATFGSASLNEAIEHEIARLNAAGVKAKLIYGGAAEKISPPVQQLCFQVVREAISNVIRHARARSVEIEIESRDGAALVSVIDDGCGIGAERSAGVGLRGVRERLELMGGRLTVESRPGRTRIAAEIPESI